MKKIEDCDIHKGHRARMRKKLEKYGGDIFDTYELLEMLLYGAVAGKDTNPISKRLLAAFGSLDGVLSAERDKLLEVDGIGERTANLITKVGSLSELLSSCPETDTEKYNDYRKVGECFLEMLKGADDYRVAVLLLDNSMRKIDAKVVFKGLDFQSGGVHASKFVSLAISSGASVVMIAHNHPFGPAFPSEGDIATTDAVASALSGVGVVLAEHYLFSGENYIGILKEFRRQVRQQPELQRFFDSKREYLGERAL